MNDYPSYIREQIKRVKELQRIKAQMDPASGITITVRIGAPHQDVDEFPERYRETTIGASYNIDTIMDVLIDDIVKSLKYWRGAIKGHVADLEKAEVELNEFLNNMKPPK